MKLKNPIEMRVTYSSLLGFGLHSGTHVIQGIERENMPAQKGWRKDITIYKITAYESIFISSLLLSLLLNVYIYICIQYNLN